MKKFQPVSVILFLGAGISILLAASFVVTPASAAAFTDCASIADVPQAECQALVDLYDSTAGASWTHNTNWKSTDTVCNWYGITCSATPQVTQISLDNKNLDGPFAGNFTGFSELYMLNLGNDPITGDIPTIFSNLPVGLVEFYIPNTDITGTIPASISSFTSLTGLGMGDNSQMTGGDLGTLLSNLPTTLEYLHLRDDDFTGTVTSDISNFTNLTFLVLGYNQLVGDLGTIIGYLPTGLEDIWMGGNDFTGTVPTSISTFTNLTILQLNGNQLDGDIEPIISNLPSGMIYFDLHENDFSGTIPASIAGLTSLKWLYLSYNQLTGDLATIINDLPVSIRSLDLVSNNFTGSIPATISTLTNLNSLRLGHNSGLSGNIPMSITTLPPLHSFYLTGTYLCEPEDPAYAAWKALVTYYYDSWCLPSFNGGVEITSPQPIVAIGRPHIGSEIMAYSGMNSGATTVYLPMLFNNAWGNYTSSFTVQNVGAGTATYSITFKDALTGLTNCVVSSQSLPQHGIKTYDVTSLPACDGAGIVPVGWLGGAKISSNLAVTVVAKPNILGSDAVTYNGFTSGAATAYLPMLFRGIWGYESAFYVQNLDGALDANISIDFYDSSGEFTCTYVYPDPIKPSAAKGFWMAFIDSGPPPDCDPGGSGTGFDPGGWAGNAVITSTGSTNIVAIGRPHLGSEVAAYSGFTSGNTTNYLPMLFRGKWGYTSAIYIQNLEGTASDVEIKFYDTDGNYTCLYTATDDVGANATKGYWIPYLACTTDSFPAEWAGSAEITTSKSTAVVGRPHLSGGQVAAYNAFTSGAADVFVPMLFRKHSGNESALYIQNLSSMTATLATITFYDEDSGFYCTMDKTIQPGASSAIWLANLDGTVCTP